MSDDEKTTLARTGMRFRPPTLRDWTEVAGHETRVQGPRPKDSGNQVGRLVLCTPRDRARDDAD